MKSLTVIALALAAAGCRSSSTITEPQVYTQLEAADSIRIRAGETIIVDGLRVTLTAVENDSRCAIDVVCVWAGDATARFTVELNCNGCLAPAFLLSLHTTLEPKSGDAHGYHVTLLRVLPEPRSTTVIQPASYTAWIRMTKQS